MVDDKLVIHSEIFGERNKEKLGRVVEASLAVDEAFRQRGVAELYTWAYTDEQYRFNQFLGFTPTGREVLFDKPTTTPVYEFIKEL
jgi:hypothetical protein